MPRKYKESAMKLLPSMEATESPTEFEVRWPWSLIWTWVPLTWKIWSPIAGFWGWVLWAPVKEEDLP